MANTRRASADVGRPEHENILPRVSHLESEVSALGDAFRVQREETRDAFGKIFAKLDSLSASRPTNFATILVMTTQIFTIAGAMGAAIVFVSSSINSAELARLEENRRFVEYRLDTVERQLREKIRPSLALAGGTRTD